MCLVRIATLVPYQPAIHLNGPNTGGLDRDDDRFRIYRVDAESLVDLMEAATITYRETYEVDEDLRFSVEFHDHAGIRIRDGDFLDSGQPFPDYMERHAVTYQTPITVTFQQKRKRPRRPSTPPPSHPAFSVPSSPSPRVRLTAVYDLPYLGALLPPGVELMPLDRVKIDLAFFAPHNRDFMLKKAICLWYKEFIYVKRPHLRRLRIHDTDDDDASGIISGYTQLGKTDDQCVLLVLLAMCSCISILVVRVNGGDDSFPSFQDSITKLADDATVMLDGLIATNQLRLTYEQRAFFRPKVIRASEFGRGDFFTGRPDDGRVLGHRSEPLIVMGRANPSDLSYIFDPEKCYRKKPMNNIGNHLDAEILTYEPGSDKRRYTLIFDEGELSASSAER